MGNRPCVLVIDDDASIRQFVDLALSDEGYEVLTAADGQAGLDLVEQRPPNLILLDLRMPSMDGWTFARTYQARVAHGAPIIALTAGRESEHSLTDLAVASFLAKPFNLDDLLDLVARHIRRANG